MSIQIPGREAGIGVRRERVGNTAGASSPPGKTDTGLTLKTAGVCFKGCIQGHVLTSCLAVLFLLGTAGILQAEVITKLPFHERAVAFTFDACETKTPAWFDMRIVDFLVGEKIPCSIFVSGKFALRNREELAKLAGFPFIRIENHSYHHFMHMERMDKEGIREDVIRNERIISDITGRQPKFFRFPAGNYDGRALSVVEALGYRVVHWSFASGDPDRGSSAGKLLNWVLSQTGAGSILIFHINGRGNHTAEVLPLLVPDLRRKGYRFAALDELQSTPGRLILGRDPDGGL